MSEKKIYISEPETPEIISDGMSSGMLAEPKPARKKATTKTKNIDTIPYEAAVARLEEIVRRLEQSREAIGLEESMKLYEEGVSLVRRCYHDLEAAEQRVKVLQQTTGGEIIAVDFDTDNE